MKSMIMKQTLPSATKIYENGKVYQLNDVQAVRFKRAGIAEYVDSDLDISLNVNTTINGEPVEIETASVEPVVEKRRGRKPRRENE